MVAGHHSRALALAILLPTSLARVIWVPAQFDPHLQLGESRLAVRQPIDTCGGLSGSLHCGTFYPAGFCCPTSTYCLPLNHTDATAVICCPNGSDCSTISVVSCSLQDQNSTIAPHSNLHFTPAEPLKSCGNTGCCPPGYACNGSHCVAHGTETTSSASQQASISAPHTSSTLSTSFGAGTTHTSTTTTKTHSRASVSPTSDGLEPGGTGNESSASSFNGASFAVGFVPGIAIGVIIAALLFMLWRRRTRVPHFHSVRKNPSHRDTLTDLSAVPNEMVFKHGRSISEPTTDPTCSHRTDFLRTTPPRVVDAPAVAPIFETPPMKTEYSHSPFLEQMPASPKAAQIPSHLKRGTLSFRISPVRALRKQRSIHSLRRHAIATPDATPNASCRASMKRLSRGRSRSRSIETIQVLMPSTEPYTPGGSAAKTLSRQTPELDDPSCAFSDDSTTWESDASPTSETDATAMTPDQRARPTPVVYPRIAPVQQTPTREPILRATERAGVAKRLGSPYSPHGPGTTKPPMRSALQPPPLQIPHAPLRRDLPYQLVPKR